MGTVIPFEGRAEKADQACAPASVGPRPRIRSARVLAVVSGLYGFTVAAAIEANAMPIAVALIVAAFFLIGRLR